MNEQPEYLIDEELEPGLRYTEHMMPTGHGEARICALLRPGEEKPVSKLKLYAFSLRFGSVCVDAEGLGGVSTEVAERKKGHLGKLMKRALAGARERVCAAFLFGVEDLYPKFGFTACLPEAKLTIWVQRLLEAGSDTDWKLEPYAERHVPEIISLFNAETATRPWSRVRTASDWPRLVHGETWRPEAECLVLTHRDEFSGYAFIAGTNYGWMPRTYEAVELAAKSDAAAEALILNLGKKSWELYSQNMVLQEPPDGRCGIIAKKYSCEMQITFNERGGGMGAILDRQRLLTVLKDELDRRASHGDLSLDNSVFAGLSDASVVPDDRHLMRLLTGYWSWREAEMWGAVAPEGYRKKLESVFPGAPSPALPMPYAHQLDRY